MFHVPNEHRIRLPLMMGSDDSCGNNGAFHFKKSYKNSLFVIACDGSDEENPDLKWEHVSVSARDYDKPRIPTWGEMCWVKAQFWDDEDCVVQYHPPKSEYVNNHHSVLHMWRPLHVEMPRPPKHYV